jgi:hypothetical protein
MVALRRRVERCIFAMMGRGCLVELEGGSVDEVECPVERAVVDDGRDVRLGGLVKRMRVSMMSMVMMASEDSNRSV